MVDRLSDFKYRACLRCAAKKPTLTAGGVELVELFINMGHRTEYFVSDKCFGRVSPREVDYFA